MSTAAAAHPHRWVCVAEAAALGTGAPLAVRAFGEGFVLWRTREGAPQCFVDRCPHRGARLSMGRLDGDTLECPYHGWRFGEGGGCRRIPALPGFKPGPALRATAWQAREQLGLIWIAAPGVPDEPTAGPQALDAALALLPPRRVLCGPFDVATSAPRVVENFLDTAHFGLVHEGWLGSREHLDVPDYKVDHDEHGRPAVLHYRAWQPRASALAEGGAWVNYSYRVLDPFCALLTKKAEGSAPQEAYALWTCPLDEEHTRVWFTLATSDASQPDADLQAFQAAIFSQDAPVLESQRPRRLPLAAGAEMHCAADRLSVAYRRWLGEQGALYGTC